MLLNWSTAGAAATAILLDGVLEGFLVGRQRRRPLLSLTYFTERTYAEYFMCPLSRTPLYFTWPCVCAAMVDGPMDTSRTMAEQGEGR